MYKDKIADCHFCSADQAAVKALVRLGLKDRSVSLEMALKRTGLSRPRMVYRHSEKAFQTWVKEAQTERIQGTGLAQDPLSR